MICQLNGCCVARLGTKIRWKSLCYRKSKAKNSMEKSHTQGERERGRKSDINIIFSLVQTFKLNSYAILFLLLHLYPHLDCHQQIIIFTLYSELWFLCILLFSLSLFICSAILWIHKTRFGLFLFWFYCSFGFNWNPQQEKPLSLPIIVR